MIRCAGNDDRLISMSILVRKAKRRGITPSSAQNVLEVPKWSYEAVHSTRNQSQAVSMTSSCLQKPDRTEEYRLHSSRFASTLLYLPPLFSICLHSSLFSSLLTILRRSGRKRLRILRRIATQHIKLLKSTQFSCARKAYRFAKSARP